MIPIGDSVRARSFPYVNVTIIVINILVFVYEVALSQQTIARNVTELDRFIYAELDRFIYEWGNVPACTFDALGRNAHLTEFGQRLCDDQPSPLFTIFSAMFMHGSPLHIAGNMLFLWIFGDNVEDAMGHLRYLAFYLLAGVIAAFTQAFTDVESLTPAIGASGAIAGVMAAYVVLFPRATVDVIFGVIFIPIPVPAIVLVGIWFVMQVFNGAAALGPDAVGAGGGVAYFAHIGGFIAGASLVGFFMWGRPRPRARRNVQYW